MTTSLRVLALWVGLLMLGVALIPGADNRLGALLLVPVMLMAGYAALAKSRVRVPDASLARATAIGVFAIGAVVFVVGVARSYESRTPFAAIITSLAVIGVLAAGLFVVLDRAPDVAWTGLLACYAVLLTLVVFFATDPGTVDVAVFQTESVAALVDGTNPYSITFPDPYDPETSARLYTEGVSQGGTLQFGYIYFPVSLLIITPFEVLFGDFRIAHAIALVATVFIIGAIGQRQIARTSALLFILTSPTLLILGLGWMDPLVAVTAAGVVWVAFRDVRRSSYALGVLFAMKQYMAFATITSILLVPRPHSVGRVVKHFLRASVVFLVLTIPFLLWDPEGFYRSVVELQFIQPFRADSVSLAVVFANQFGAPPVGASIAVQFVAIFGISILVVRRSQTGGQAFAIGTGFVMLVAVALSKQAFVNYFLIVTTLLCLGAAAEARLPDTDVSHGHRKVAAVGEK